MSVNSQLPTTPKNISVVPDSKHLGSFGNAFLNIKNCRETMGVLTAQASLAMSLFQLGKKLVEPATELLNSDLGKSLFQHSSTFHVSTTKIQ